MCLEVTLGDRVDFCSCVCVGELCCVSVWERQQGLALDGEGSPQRPRGCYPSLPGFAQLDLG